MATTLVFIRHAKPDQTHMGDDFSKPLSEEGFSQMKSLVETLRHADILPDVIYTSPLRRAVQSAEIIADLMEAPLVKEAALGVLFDADTLLQLIDESSSDTLFFVGHAPSLAEFVESLVGQQVLPDGLPKAAAAVVSFDGKGMLIKVLK